MSSKRLRHINGATAGGLNTLTSHQNHPEASRLNSPGQKGQKQIPCSTKDANSSPYWKHSKDSQMHDVAAAPQDDVLELKKDSHTSIPSTCLSIEEDCHMPSMRLHKRARTLNPAEMPTPHIKRSKIRQMESVESEDELGNDHCKQKERKTTPSGVVSQRRRVHSRGDIQPTQFGDFLAPRRANDAQAGGSYDIPDLAVRRAVSGKHFYTEDDEPHGSLILQQIGNSATLVPKSSTQDNSTLKWMTLALDSVKSIEHAMTESKYVHIIRPRGNSFGADLWLEFADYSDVTSLIKSAANVESCSLSRDKLQIRYKKAMDTAESFAAAKRNQRTQKRRLSGSRTVSTELDEAVLTTQRGTRNAAAGGPRQERIIDKLNKSIAIEANKDTTNSVTNGDDNSVSVLPIARRTRRSFPAHAPREFSPDVWTSRNPEWQKSWHRSLIFPPAGKNRATVDEVDIARLDEGQFLNDNLISFYIRYLQFKLEHDQPDLLKKVYIFSTFFFEKLTSTRGKFNFEGVKAWTAKFDLLSYDYIVVPVNENAHWYLAIICNTPNAVNGIPENARFPRKEDTASPGATSIAQALSDVSILDDDALKLSANQPTGSDPYSPGKAPQQSSSAAKNATPRKLAGVTNADTILPKIVTLDSLGNPHAATCKALKEYLIAEAKDKKGVDLAMVPTGMTAKRIPEQNNLCDCGVFVLGYMEEFLKDPDETARKLVQKEPVNWNIRPSLLRNQVRNLLFELQDEQQEQLRKKAIQKQAGVPRNTEPLAAQDSNKDVPSTTPSSPLIEGPSTDDTSIHTGKAHGEKFSPSNVTSVSGFPSTPLAPSRRSMREPSSHRASARKRAPTPATRPEQPPDNNLIHIIPSSPSEVESSTIMTTPRAQSRVSPEFVDTDKLIVASSRGSTGQKLSQTEENRTLYDGIDLSVNST